MYPLSSLALLSADVHHKHLMVLQLKDGFCDSNGPRTTADDILLWGHILGIKQPIQVRIEVQQAVVTDALKQPDAEVTVIKHLLFW